VNLKVIKNGWHSDRKAPGASFSETLRMTDGFFQLYQWSKAFYGFHLDFRFFESFRSCSQIEVIYNSSRLDASRIPVCSVACHNVTHIMTSERSEDGRTKSAYTSRKAKHASRTANKPCSLRRR
jgi:hypothetical protein